MLELGKHEYQYADKQHQVDGSTLVKLVPVQERYLYIHMPWKRKFYNINTDSFERRAPKLGIFWHKHPTHKHVSYARWSWC
jgi:hypothetical protein